MTPAELIEEALRKHMRIRPQERAAAALKAGEPILVTGGEAEQGAEIALRALAGAGLVVVPAEDLYHVTEIAENYLDMCEPPPADELVRVTRLRAALPERSDHA